MAFLRHLPKRAEAIGRRGRRFCRDGWDINGLSLLYEDVQRLAGVSGRYGVLEVSQQLLALESVMAEFLEREQLPDAEANERIVRLLDELAPHIPNLPAERPEAAAARYIDSPRVELAPPNYWRRWTADAAPAIAVDFAANDAEIAYERYVAAHAPEVPTSVSSEGTVSDLARSAPAPEPLRTQVRKIGRMAPITIVPSPVPAPTPPVATPRPPHHRLYHLTNSSALAVQLDQKLEALGYELELIDSAAELKEILSALAPDAIIVDAAFLHDLESIGGVLRTTRERSGSRVRLLALSEEDSVQARLSARRAGADALLIKPGSAEEVLQRVQDLLAGDPSTTTYRILVVEDDRSQALFAESILRNAGMDALVVTDAFDVLDAMQRFKPDLVLMDLYMPQCDGTELTALIREREEFLNTPIVFLSGESDQDKHYEALSVGGDDFLSKPIRPKYLIASVENRVRRARALQQRQDARDPRDPATGLHNRSYLLDRLNEVLGGENVRERLGGVLLLEFDGVATLRERLGLSGAEQLFSDAAAFLVKQLEGMQIASRYSDGCIVVMDTESDDGALEIRAAEMRSRLATQAFSIANLPLRLRASVGVCAFRHGFADAGTLLNAAERASREARGTERGVHRFEPPKRIEDEQAAALLASIQAAVEQDGFELLYQPIVALQGGDEAQYQTLLRLRDDMGRLHAAAAIVPLALKAGLMLEVDRWVLTQTMRVIDDRRHDARPVKLFVSQCAASMVSAEQGAWLAAQLQARRLQGHALVIELALDDVSPHIVQVAEFCNELVPSGVKFCLSRFEGGPEGDAVLDQLPVEYIKLAPKYLAAAGLRDELRVIVDRAHRRGLAVIAPRVEDAQSAATLWMSGIDYIQGNLVQLATRELDFDFQAAVL